MDSAGKGLDAERVDRAVREIDRILKAADIRVAATAADVAARGFDSPRASVPGSVGVGPTASAALIASAVRKGEDSLARVESHVIDRQLSLLRDVRRVCASSGDTTVELDLRELTSSSSQGQVASVAALGGRRRFAAAVDAARLVAWAVLVFLAAAVVLVNT